MKKTYSIILPTYNSGELLDKTIKSIISQDKDLYECIIIDGKSSDNTLDIILKYTKEYPDNIRYISEEDRGIYDAMNKGIGLSKGEYLYFIGAGDTLFENSLSRIKEFLNFKLEIIYGNVYFSGTNVISGREYNNKNLSISLMSHQSIFYNKQIFDIVGIYNLKYKVVADNDLNIRIFGNKYIKKIYVDIDIAYYAEGGFSEVNEDANFFSDYKHIIDSNLGNEYYYEYYIKSGKKFYDFLRFSNYKKALIIGDRVGLNKISKEIIGKESIEFSKLEVLNLELNIVIDSLQKIDFRDVDIIVLSFSKENFSYKVFDFINTSFKNIVDSAIFNSFVKSDELIDFVKNDIEGNLIIFGASKLGEKVFDYLKVNFERLTIKCFFDNNKSLENTKFCGVTIYNPNDFIIDSGTYIFIASTWQKEIYEQLLEKGMDKNKIIKCI